MIEVNFVPVSSSGAEVDDAAGVVVEGDGGEPDVDAAVAEGLCGDEEGFADHGDFDPLAGDAFHSLAAT